MSKYYSGFGHIDIPWGDCHKNLYYLNHPSQTYETYSMFRTWPDFFELDPFYSEFTWHSLCWSFNVLLPSASIPPRIESYTKFKSLYPNSQSEIFQAVVFLDDWEIGHNMTIGDDLCPQWSKGDYVWWRYDTPIGEENTSSVNRYTLHFIGYSSDGNI